MSKRRVAAARVSAVAAAVVLSTGCAAAAPGSQSGPRGTTATSEPAVPALPAGGASAPDGDGLMITVSGSGPTTSIRGYDRTTHALLRTVELRGRYTLPRVVPEGPTEGFAHDGSLFVLTGEPTGAISRFAVLGTMLDAPARIVELPAAFSYDALAPDGSVLYLIEHLAPVGSQHYQVRAYDLTAQRLDDAVVVDKANIGEEMAGHPTSRVTSPDGTVVSTMYERVDGAPFIHVLNTPGRFARCIDLPGSARGTQLAGAGNLLALQDSAGLVRLTVDLDAGTTAVATLHPTMGATGR